MKIHPTITDYVGKDKIKSICVYEDVAYVTDKCGWTYKFNKEEGHWDLDKIRMKRRYNNGRFKTHNGRRLPKQRSNKKARSCFSRNY